MTRGLLSALIVAAGASIAIAPANAQPIPSGSYQRTCENISVYDTTLRARCQTSDGDRTNSQLEDFDECDGDIGNNDGNLTCARDTGRDDDNDSDNRDYDRLPPGSYQQSCQQERASDGDLTANCADRNGRLHQSRMQNYASCRGDISNDNGTLRCSRDDSADNDDDGDFAVPVGTWRASCREHRMSRNVLIAECRNRAGRWVVTSVDLTNCRQGVSNENGQLVCVRSWTPSWRVSLYLNKNYRGAGRTFTNDVPDLARYGFANSVSSAYVRSGAWQLCSRPYYSGRCVTLRSAAAPNLARMGINDKVRSLRRVR